MASANVTGRDFLVAAGAAALDTLLFTRLLEAGELQERAFFDVPSSVVVALGMVAVPILTLRRQAPVAACLGLTACATVLTVTIGSRPLLTLMVSLYTVAAYCRLGPAFACLLTVLAAHSLSVRYEVSSAIFSWTSVLALAALFVLLEVAAWTAGRWAAASRARARNLVETRAVMAAEAVNVERLRIARELHDIVAHAVTVMVLQATGANRMVVTEPNLAREAMQSVQDVGRQAMSELRRLLEVLRAVSDVDQQHGTGTECRISTLDHLIDRVRATGVAVTLSTQGAVGHLDPSVDLTAYRIVQEALTNTTRHAGPGSAADVQLRWFPDILEIEITDNGAGSPHPVARDMSSGYGILGLRERVKLIGGQIQSGSMTLGGYRVFASLPAGPP